ncbi:hypothetical protein [[Eubacterium] cellulosolvens]
MSDAKYSEKIIELIEQLDSAYEKGLMNPEEYRTLRHGLEIRLTPPKRPSKKRKFKLKYALIAVIIIVIVSASSLLLMQTNMAAPGAISFGNKPSFEISNVKFAQATLSFDIKNTGTAEATNVELILRSGEGDIPIRVIDSIRPEDPPMNINKGINLGENQELYGVQFNIVVTCNEDVSYLYPFTP